MCTTVINATGGKFAIGFNNTGRKIAPGINDIGSKFAACVINTGCNLPPTTPAANLPPLSMTLVANNGNNIRLLRLKVNLKAKMYL
jgi:hypothetical protein